MISYQMEIAVNNLNQIFENVSGTSFIGLDTVTQVPLSGGKSNSMQGKVYKRVLGSSVMVFQNKTGSSYERIVQRRLEQEGKDPSTFELQPRKWGQRIPNSPLIEYNGKYYIEVIFLKAGEVTYWLDGKQIDKADIIGLKENVASKDSQGSLENKVVIRSYSVDSIASIRIDHHQFNAPFVVM